MELAPSFVVEVETFRQRRYIPGIAAYGVDFGAVASVGIHVQAMLGEL